MANDYILEVSWGYPSAKWPVNGIFQKDQAEALQQIGEKVVFLALDLRSIKKWRKWGIQSHIEDKMPVYEFNFPYGPLSLELKFKIQDYCFEKAMKTIEKKYGKPHCIHVHTCQQAMAVTKYCKQNSVPFYITEHVWPIDMGEKVNARLKETYKNATKVIAVSTALSDVLKDYCGVDSVVIHNIVDFSSFEYKEKDDDSNDEFRLVSAAQIDYRKGMDILVKGYSEFLKTGIDSHLTIMGDGSQLENIKSLVKELGIQEKVSFAGRYSREEFAEELHRSDCFVLVSRDETFGIVYVEAMACGVPAIASDCGGPSDIIDDQNGILIPMEDPQALTRAMKEIYEARNSFDRKAIAENCKAKYNAVQIASQIKKVLIN